MKKQNGFTLVELTIVIIILGILVAVSAPKFINMRTNAHSGVVNGFAGTLGSAAIVNNSGCQLTGGVVVANQCVKVRKCSDLLGATIGIPPLVAAGAAVVGQYNLASDSAVALGGVVSCTLQYGVSPGVTVTGLYNAIGAAN